MLASRGSANAVERSWINPQMDWECSVMTPMSSNVAVDMLR